MRALDKYIGLARLLLNDPRRFFDMVLARYGIKKNPPYRIPEELKDRFTLNGKIKVISGYCDDSQSQPTRFKKESIQAALDKIEHGETGLYGGVDTWLYNALEKYSISGKKIAIIGTADQGYGPWYECICLHYGGMPVTVEYNDIIYEDDRFEAIHPSELKDGQPVFDAAFAISSFEHDGLGRYGDPIVPDGDLRAMAEWKGYVKDGGLMYLAVPIGVDKIIFNANRIYGKIRLPLLLNDWEMIDSFGFDNANVDRDTGYGWMPRNADGSLMHPECPEYSPILVLRNS
jgi:hypothetical protein